jgi:hypothetical protein
MLRLALVRRVACICFLSQLVGCSFVGWDSYNEVSVAIPPIASATGAPIRAALNCIRSSGVLRNTRIAIAIHADGTGKYNHIAEGSTGNYLPQGTTAVWASEAVLLAGGQAFNYYELNTERAMRAFLSNEAQAVLSARQQTTLPDYVLSTSFPALDFIGGPDLDIRIAGVGPRFTGRGASIEAVAELYRPGTRTILQVSSIQRYVAFRELGFSISRLVGGLLVTGGGDYQDQQRLQEATRDVIALAVANVLSKFPKVPQSCRIQVEALEVGTPDRATAHAALWAAAPELSREVRQAAPVGVSGVASPGPDKSKDPAHGQQQRAGRRHHATDRSHTPGDPPKLEQRTGQPLGESCPSSQGCPRPETLNPYESKN